MLRDEAIVVEIKRIKAQFETADPNKLAALEGLIEQAAYEYVFLRQMNQLARETGLVRIHPDNPETQTILPVSNAIAKHSAAYTNILDKLCKHLAPNVDDNYDDLDEYQ